MGDTLHDLTISDSLRTVFQSKLDSAKTAYATHPDSAEAKIWYGRRLAYLDNYHDAIEIYSEGIEQFPKDARFYRHRGHRYITTRQFYKAVSDLKKATELIKNIEDSVEPDGLPNEQNKPRSTLHTNIWYHLGLAQYLNGDFEQSVDAFQKCLDASPNDDMIVASTYWLYMSIRRAGMDLQAGNILEPITEGMNIIENDTYHKLLMVFKGNFEEKVLLNDSDTPLNDATIGYGLGNWHYINGRQGRAQDLFRKVYEGDRWNAFGYIAAETDLNRLSFE
jgi:tetratricopeptide (TPR) repeat protein